VTSLDVKGAFDAASWTSILHGLKEFNCPRNLYNLSKGYFSNRTAVLTMNNISETRGITKGCPPNENKSRTTLMSRRRTKEKKEI